MTEFAKEESFNKKLCKDSLKLFLKILLIVVAGFFFLIAILFYLAPKTDAKIFNFFGLTRVEEKCYEQVYKNSGSTSDLYNLIIFDMNNGLTDKELENILKIYEVEDYIEFCQKLDNSGIVSANGNKSLYVYVGDTNAFLKNQEMKCTIELGLDGKLDDWKSKTVNLALESLSTGNLTNNSFETFMSFIISTDNLSGAEKQIFVNLLSEKIIDGQEVIDLIQAKLDCIRNAYIENSENEVQKILLKNAEVKLVAGKYYYEKLTGNNNLAEETEQDYNAVLNEYKSLIN